jgi:hypothetical protein
MDKEKVLETARKLLTQENVISTMENVQKYVLGHKKNGDPRAIYDVFRDYVNPKKAKHNKKKRDSFSLLLETRKKKRKKNKHWKF